MDSRARARFRFVTEHSRLNPCNFPNRRLAMPATGDLLPEEFQYWTMLGELLGDPDPNGEVEGYVEWLSQRPAYLLTPGFKFNLTRGGGVVHARCTVISSAVGVVVEASSS